MHYFLLEVSHGFLARVQVLSWHSECKAWVVLRARGRCFKSVDPVSDCSPKLVPIDEEPNHQIVHLLRLGETDRATDQSLDPRP
jgi:hypothetical protein